MFPAGSFIEVSDAEEASETESLVKAEEAADKSTSDEEEERREEESGAQSPDTSEEVNESVNEAPAASEWDHIDTVRLTLNLRYMTLEHKTSHKSQYCEIQMYASSESRINHISIDVWFGQYL